MLQGARVQLHPGTVCTITSPRSKFDGASCSIRCYNAQKRKWQVQLMDKERGKEVLVAEESLKLEFCLLPKAEVQFYQKVGFESTQGTCGRGLIAMQDMKKGLPIFEEPPLIVAFKSSTSSLEHHTVRWRAYRMLTTMAEEERQAAAHGAWTQALAAFDELGVADEVPKHVADAAEQLAARDCASGSLAESQRSAHRQRILGVLMRFLSNQFGHENVSRRPCRGLMPCL